MLERIFHLSERGTTPRTEFAAGLTTFMTMAYIVFVQPAVLSQAGMDPGAVMTATCLSAALATIMMGLYANYPIALAPGMGENFYFTFAVCLGMGVPWRVALGAIFVEGVLFMLLSVWKVRERLIETIPESLQCGIAAGIGLFIAFIGLVQGGIVVRAAGTPLALGKLASPPTALSVMGLLLTATLAARRVKGAVLWGMLATAAVGIPLGIVSFHGVVGPVPSLAPTFLKMDVAGALSGGLFTVIFVFLFMDVFDTVGTVVGVGQAAGLMKNGKLPRAGRVLFTDAVGTAAGAALGTSTVTSYIESAAGVAAGGRTGLAAVVTGICFLAALFFHPLVKTIGAGYALADGTVLHPVTAPALIVVGFMIMLTVRRIAWDDPTEALPAFLAIVGIPLTYNIADGMALGFISYAVVKVCSGRGRDVHWMPAAIAAAFVARYILMAR